MLDTNITRDANRVIVQGPLGIADLYGPLVCVHKAINEAGYKDLLLDFSKCTAAFSAPMLALCCQVTNLRISGIDFELILPADTRLTRLFQNANWAHYLDPYKNDLSSFRGYTQIPATKFRSPDEQNRAVNRIVNSILGAIPDIERPDFAALEWSINEITDNVLTHSESNVGGLVQVSTFQKARKRLEYIVADAGVGIPTTLRATHPNLRTDAEALDRAIREGVTRDKSIGQGNGLFGSYQICSHSRGFFQVVSGYGKLVYSERNGLHVSTEKVPYAGTLVAATIDFSQPHLLEQALQFGGKLHAPVDFIETHYEAEDAERIVFVIKDEATSFGSRPAGTPLRTKLGNLAQMCPGQRIYIDFSDIALISSSFADEVFGKLFAELGALSFMQRFEFMNVSQTVRQLVDRAIAQRMAVTG